MPVGRVVARLLVLVALVSGCQGGSEPPGGVLPLDRLSTAVTGVATTRAALLAAVGAVQDGATAVDTTDALCADGKGVAARDSRRSSTAIVTRAGTATAELPGRVSAYRAALTALDTASVAVKGTQLQALKAVVRDGQAEATAVAAFHAVVKTAWQQYASLDGLEKVWITRSVAGWYRTAKEGADAYSVLVSPGRRFVLVARSQLESAAQTVRVPSAAQSATLAAADRALASLRSTPN